MILIGIIVSNVEAALIVVLGAGLIGVIYLIAKSAGGSSSSGSQSAEAPPPDRTVSPPWIDAEDEVAVRRESPRRQDYRVPPPPPGVGPAKWVPQGKTVTVMGTDLPGGMLYVGTRLPTPSGANDPALIDLTKAVAASGDYREPQSGYWWSYSELTAARRRAYLNWLADGRCDPQAYIGYVFLYFYGLERRVLVDAPALHEARQELPAILAEVQRLLSIYGGNDSFRRYATGLISWIHVAKAIKPLYEEPLPPLERGKELPLPVRVALGQAAAGGVPVPPPLAAAWVRLDPSIPLPRSAQRCGEQFDKLFQEEYRRAFGNGMVLPRNRTTLKPSYMPASAGLRSYALTLEIGTLPDVSALTSPHKQLLPLVKAVAEQLESYSRFVGKNPEAADASEGLLLLPMTLWPSHSLQALEALKARVGHGGMAVMTFDELLGQLDVRTLLTRDKGLAIARALESMDIGMEPDLLAGAKTPKPYEKLVLFALPASEPASSATPAYQAAQLTLQLAAAVAAADGSFSAKEIDHLREQVQSWSHLTPSHRRRLLAHLRLLMVAPVPLAALKKKLEPLPTAAREAIAALMATVAQADGTVSPDEVKMLEKVYRALGVDPQRVFSDLHAVAASAQALPTAPAVSASPAAAPATLPRDTGLALDAGRIAALQEDTAKVSALLAEIFVEDDLPPPTPEVEPEAEPEAESLLGLDEAHAALARLLLSRSEWSRNELQDAAADLNLMLDGALERINDQAFERYDIPFTEGDDPLEVNTEILEKIVV